jgi:hypothetical protein
MLKLIAAPLFILYSFIGVTQNTEGKTIDVWLIENNYSGNSNYLYSSTVPKSTNKLDDTQIEALKKSEESLAKKSLKNKILEDISEIASIDFNNLEKYFTESDKKTIQVVCVINKKDVSDFWVKDIERRLDNLKSSLNEYQISEQLTSPKIEDLLNRTRVIRREIDRCEQIAFKLNPNMNMSNINLIKSDIDGRINDLNSRMDETIRNEELKIANKKKNNQDYIGAYIAFKDLQLDYPNNSDVLSGIEESFSTLIKIYDYRMSQFELNENYDAAIKTVDSLLNLNIELVKKYSSKLDELRKRKFNQICDKIEKILAYKSLSSEQLKNYMSELKELKDINPERYNKLKSSSDNRLLDYEIKLIKSDVYNENYVKALNEIPLLKITYAKSKRIESFEREIDRKIYYHIKKVFLQNRPRLFNFEPSVFVMTPPNKSISNQVSGYYNLNFNYSLGIYRRLGIKPKNKIGNFKYSSLGLKFDYLDSKQTFNVNDSSIYERNKSFCNIQLSLGIRKFIYLDLGFLSYNNIFIPSLYTVSVGLYLPLGYFSLGVNLKYLTDFKQTNLLMTGAGIKLNFGFLKKFNSNDKNEIQTSILKLKQ